MCMFRDLKPDEIDIRVQSISETGFILLLYKNARVDQDILDEKVGELGWQRKHTRDNANCTVEIWDDIKKQWIGKEDTGTESFTEKEKGLASDSFKRACFNWGIGRELYTAPFIWINDKEKKYIKLKNGKNVVYEHFSVYHLKIENKKITEIGMQDSKNAQIFKFMLKK